MAEDLCEEDPILLVGRVCMDIILTCSHYPLEDSFNRALDFAKRRGGNVSNSCTVLSLLGTKSEILACFGGDEYAEFLKRDLLDHGISYKHSPMYPQCKTPFTSIIISHASGSRTGLHFRGDFPENTFEDFRKIDLSQYSWIHFEGRFFTETQKMISWIDTWNEKSTVKKLRYSVELEKCNEETKMLIPLADYLFVSKDFALHLKYENMLSAVNGISLLARKGATVIIPWGDQGAIACCANGDIVQAPAYPPQKILDSIGAGDTFIAATITYLNKHKHVKDAIDFGCKVAGAKVGITGFTGLREKFSS